MTAQINRSARFVEKNGSLTQYGWAVLQGVWVSTGGATGGTAPTLDDGAVETLTTGPEVTPGAALSLLPHDVAPGAAAVFAAHDVAPSGRSDVSAHDVAPN